MQDARDWKMGRYMQSAIASIFGGKDAHYLDKPILDSEFATDVDPEANERLAAEEMRQYIMALNHQGNLPQTVIADIKES